MRIRGRGGASVFLTPRGWEFRQGTGPTDDRWLVINAGAVLDDGSSWSFTEPCLLIDEARELSRWLVGAGTGWGTSARFRSLAFIEQLVSFEVAGRTGAPELLVRAFFQDEGAPGWARGGQAVDLHVRPRQLLAAAEVWATELAALPARP